MRLYVIGCEYAGKTTLLEKILQWQEELGVKPIVHDHFTFPSPGSLVPYDRWERDDEAKLMSLSAGAQARLTTWGGGYHTNAFLHGSVYNDVILDGFLIEEYIYGPLYYGYKFENPGAASGEVDKDYVDFDMDARNRMLEMYMLEKVPGTILVHVTASAECIKQRMHEHPHSPGRIKEEHIPQLLESFDEQYKKCLITQKITIDTTDLTADEAFEVFKTKVWQHLEERDLLRIMLHKMSETKG